jgi:hypothetical protein
MLPPPIRCRVDTAASFRPTPAATTGFLQLTLWKASRLASHSRGAERIATWRSEHKRATIGRPIAIYHSLLLFLKR